MIELPLVCLTVMVLSKSSTTIFARLGTSACAAMFAFGFLKPSQPVSEDYFGMSFTDRENASVLCLFDVDGTLTAPRLVCRCLHVLMARSSRPR